MQEPMPLPSSRTTLQSIFTMRCLVYLATLWGLHLFYGAYIYFLHFVIFSYNFISHFQKFLRITAKMYSFQQYYSKRQHSLDKIWMNVVLSSYFLVEILRHILFRFQIFLTPIFISKNMIQADMKFPLNG